MMNKTRRPLMVFLFPVLLLAPVAKSAVYRTNNKNQFLYQGDPEAEPYIREHVGDGSEKEFETYAFPKVVEFYSPLCGHCLMMKPRYIEVAKEVKKFDDTIEFFAVSCKAHHDLCKDNGISGYPSIFAVPAGGEWYNSEDKILMKAREFTAEGVKKALMDKPKKMESGIPNISHVEPGADAAGIDQSELGKYKDIMKAKLAGKQQGGIKAPQRMDPLARLRANADVTRLMAAMQLQRGTRGTDGTDAYRLREDKLVETLNKKMEARQKRSQILNLKTKEKPKSEKTKSGKTKSEKTKPEITKSEKMKTEKSQTEKTEKPRPVSFKKEIKKARLVEKVPVMRKMVKLSHEEELILDASLSFLEGLKKGVYFRSDPRNPLGAKQKKVLKDWLELASVGLPSEWSLHEVIGDLVNNIDLISRSKDDLMSVLNKHPFPRKTWSKSCNFENGFYCGYWKLMHVITVGMAAHRGGLNLIDAGLARKDIQTFAPSEAADVFREYMAFFFPDEKSSNSFLSHYDVCENNRRCIRLTNQKENAYGADWKEVGKWFWEVHNDVKIRILNEKMDDKRKSQQRSLFRSPGEGPGAASLEEEARLLWPSVDDCIQCFNEDGTYHEDAVFLYLEKIYWPGFDLEDTPSYLLIFEDEHYGGTRWSMLLLFLCLVIIVCLGQTISKNSVQKTMLQAKTIGTRVVVGEKKKDRSE